jgi:hypothetical protein
MHRTRDARSVGSLSLVSRVAIHRAKGDRRAGWRAASSEAFALYVIVAGFGHAPKTILSSVRISVFAHHVSQRTERIVHNASQACDAQPDRKIFLPRFLGQQEASAYATRGSRGVHAEVEAAAYATLARKSTRIT